MQVSYPYDCSVFLREKSRALPNNVALSFLEVYQYFYWHIKNGTFVLNITAFKAFTLYSTYIFFYKQIQDRKNTIVTGHFEIQYKSFFLT